LFFCFKIARSAEKRARQYPAVSSLGHMAFALRLSLVAFTGTALFASNAYMYYFPMLAGLCVAVDRAITAEVAAQVTAGSAQPDAKPHAAKTLEQSRPGAPAANRVTAWERPPYS